MSPILWNPSTPPRGRRMVLSNPQEQWKLSLQEIKLLYMKRQYRQCASRSADVLSSLQHQVHKIHRAYLHYYCASSYESLGCASHNFSTNKIPLLRIAMKNYSDCKASLESAFATPESPDESRDGDVSSDESLILDMAPVQSSLSGNRQQRSGRLQHAGYQPCVERERAHSPTPTPRRSSRVLPLTRFPSYPSGPDGLQRDEQRKKMELIPLPLQIRKSRRTRREKQLELANKPLDVPLLKRLPDPPIFAPVSKVQFTRSPVVSNGHRTRSATSSPVDLLDPTPRALGLISSLARQVDQNITRLACLVAETAELQRLHNATKNHRMASFWSFTPKYTRSTSTMINGSVETGRNLSNGSRKNNDSTEDREASSSSASGAKTEQETKLHRILRLKANGWRTVGIKSPERGWKGASYYEKLCSEALSELYEQVEAK
ncbi:hypothetical protein FQN57_006845 [Myotisia sp. PD_48]|nr:hypothetical protein FQN57_006845 [Myotisia sp. PD_48]